jgi:streptogramin lyase
MLRHVAALVVLLLSWPVHALQLAAGDIVFTSTIFYPLAGGVYRLNPTTGAIDTIATVTGLPRDVALEPSGSLLVTVDTELVRIDPTDGSQAMLGDFGAAIYGAVVVDETGRIFSMGRLRHSSGAADAGILEIDPITGAVTPIALGLEFWTDDAGLAITKDGDFLVAVNGKSSLVENGGILLVDATSLAVSVLVDHGPSGDTINNPETVVIGPDDLVYFP